MMSGSTVYSMVGNKCTIKNAVMRLCIYPEEVDLDEPALINNSLIGIKVYWIYWKNCAS